MTQYKPGFTLAFRSAYYVAFDLAEHTAALGITVVNGFDIFSRLITVLLLPLFVIARYVAGPVRKRRGGGGGVLAHGIEGGRYHGTEKRDNIAWMFLEMWKKAGLVMTR